jgi:hypothetical protein
VVLDKPPFAPPDDPVLAACIDKINKEGRNAFMEYQLPRAVIISSREATNKAWVLEDARFKQGYSKKIKETGRARSQGWG